MRCPYCGRDVTVFGGRFTPHNTNGVLRNGTPCPLSSQRVPITGLSDRDHAARAELITQLAFQVQDMDPTLVWDYLTCLDGAEIQRLLMFSLAALDIDKTVHELWDWVTALPVARLEAA